MLFVIIDDQPERFNDYDFGDAQLVFLTNVHTALGFLAECWTNDIEIDRLYLDHDLGEQANTRIIALFLKRCAMNHDLLWIDTVYVHSMNPVGKDWLCALLDTHYQVIRHS